VPDKEIWDGAVKRQTSRERFYLQHGKTKGYIDRVALRSDLAHLIFFMDPKTEVDIADIGAGPFCQIGYYLPGVKVNVFPSDLLGNNYQKIMRELGLTSTIPVEKQDMENLTYPDGRFDIVYCSNALDHCFNPKKAIQEMIRVCKPDGYVYLRHYRNIGSRMKYEGLHHWNVAIVGTDCQIWERSREGDFWLSELGPFENEVIDDRPGEKPKLVCISILRKP
jgi:SAM-dependent methyltransferase